MINGTLTSGAPLISNTLQLNWGLSLSMQITPLYGTTFRNAPAQTCIKKQLLTL